MTVVETERFLEDMEPLMSDAEREELVAFMGANPEAGRIIPETGGVRKVRWALAGRGKRGGARVIYYYHSGRLPLFLLTAYPKNEKANLSKAERNAMRGLVQILVAGYPAKKQEDAVNTKTKTKRTAQKAAKKRPTVGASIIEGLEQAIAWTRGENRNVRVTLVSVPDVDVRKVRTKMRLSQAQFATKFGFPPATLRNWEQGRSRPDAPTRVLLAVIAKHPEAVEDVLGMAS